MERPKSRQMVQFLVFIWLLVVQPGLGFTSFSAFKLRSFITLRASTTASETDHAAPHVRRKRYAGSYPRFFIDRHKERGGDSQTIAKVVAKGGTPAGQHRPVMLQECLRYLGLRDPHAIDDQHDGGLQASASDKSAPVCIDCTLGYGGHSTAILSTIAPLQGTLYAVDQDAIELAKTKARMNPLVDDLKLRNACKHTILHTKHANFGQLIKYTNGMNITGKVNALLCDLGYSSMQVDDPSRGFTYKAEGPLDMRMDTSGSTLSNAIQTSTAHNNAKRSVSAPRTAYQYLLDIPSPSALASVLSTNSDLEPAFPIALALLGPSREVRDPPKTTTEFASRVRTALDAYSKKRTRQKNSNGLSSESKSHAVDYTDKGVVDSCIAKALQAIRIEVNAEFEMLEMLLHDLPRILAPGGRAVFLTFHSGEDRRVKKAFKSGAKDGIYSSWGRDVVLPSPEECFSNPRSKCAKLRWAVRSDLR